ncbi:Acyl-CoA N-acyltransferase [Penicillium brevicompactum]|uniref:Acyl-CoA N-acyltransferase n=1 Tax=Penicillium brevicompactum TaxID=5074 RepID=A0A9W9R109_PENBR|nr:Acyl-CoA N-acyltransferase [Penicillium brevicompactum]
MGQEREPCGGLPEQTTATDNPHFTLFGDSIMTPAAKIAKARAIARSPRLHTLNPNEVNVLIQNLGDITSEQAKEIGRRWHSVKKEPSPERRWVPGREDEDHSCPEMLPKARDGPGAEPNSKIYQYLAQPRLSPDVENPEPWADFGTPSVLPDHIYGDEGFPNPNWSKHKIDNEKFRSQWKVRNEAHVKAYEDSQPMFPIVMNGQLTLTTEMQKIIYTPKPTTTEDAMLPIEPEDRWNNWHYSYRVSSISLPNEVVRDQFFSWFNQLPDDPQVVNIFRAAFFNGTALSDGISDMFLPDLKHLPTPRNMQETLTRLHWHETSEGYVYNWSPANQKRIKAEEERQKELRRTAPHRAWLNLPPGSKIVHPSVYLRPAELYDAERVLEIMQWYTNTSFASGDVKPMDRAGYEKLLSFCRDEKLPFIVAAQRGEIRYCDNHIDPAVGFAYVGYHRATNDADASIGELQVFVQERIKRHHIGRALIHMTLSCFETDLTAGITGDYRFDTKGTVQYGPGTCRPLSTLLCAVADRPGPQKEHKWVKEWLKRDFGFQEKCVFEGARMKFGKPFDLYYMARQVSSQEVTALGGEVDEANASPQSASVDVAPLIDLFD